MKKLFLLTGILFLITTFSYSQAHRDAVPQGDAIDTLSLVIGVVIGIIIGYLIGARMHKK
jgi:hypothetical protein